MVKNIISLLLMTGAFHAGMAVDYVPSAVIARDVTDLNQLGKLTPLAKKGHTVLSSNGSGFFADALGRVVTNYHVVKGAREIVMVYGGVAYAMKVKAKNSAVDLALLEFDGVPKSFDEKSLNSSMQTFPNIGVRKKSRCDVGEQVYVVGFPQVGLQGLESKVTKGIVSSVTGFQGEKDNFQMDAPIQGGNSGGPVVDTRGRLVGVAVATLRGGQNVNYAINSAELLKFLSNDIVVSKDVEVAAKSDVEMIRRVRNSTVLILNYASADSGAALRSALEESENVRESNEARTRLAKTILYARLLKLKREWAELKEVTEGLIASGSGNDEVLEMNNIAREGLGEHFIVVCEVDGKDVKARVKPICGIRDAFVECEVPIAVDDSSLKRGFPVRADLEYRSENGLYRGKIDETYDWRGTKEIRVVLHKDKEN